jgi:hypothetical protein
MKVFVKPTFLALDENTMLRRGVNYIDEEIDVRTAARAEEKCALRPDSIELYDGPDEGYDVRGTRKKKEEEARIEAIKAKSAKMKAEKEAKVEEKEEVSSEDESDDKPKKKKLRK